MYLIYTYDQDLALDNLQWLICHKIILNQSISYDDMSQPSWILV